MARRFVSLLVLLALLFVAATGPPLRVVHAIPEHTTSYMFCFTGQADGPFRGDPNVLVGWTAYDVGAPNTGGPYGKYNTWHLHFDWHPEMKPTAFSLDAPACGIAHVQRVEDPPYAQRGTGFHHNVYLWEPMSMDDALRGTGGSQDPYLSPENLKCGANRAGGCDKDRL